MKNIFLLPFITILLLLGCGKRNEHAKHTEPAIQYTCPMHPQIIRDAPGNCPICGMTLVKKESTTDTKAIMLSESQIKLANITTTLTRLESIGKNTLLTGKLVVNEEQTEVISSRVQGRMEKLHLKEVGQRVLKGQPLYELYSEQLLTLQQEYLLALRQSEELQADRYKSFLAAAEKKLLLYGMSQEQIRQLALRKKSDSRITFLSPVTGILARIDATEGQYVIEGSSLFRIEKLNRVWVEAELYAGESDLVKEGDLIQVIVNGFENKSVSGKVIFKSPEYRQGTQILTLRAVIENPTGTFLPGTEATVVLSHSSKEAIAIPIDAIIRDANGSHVWVLGKDGAFSPRTVETGIENVDKVEIISGLAVKENVVITGGYLLYGELVLKRGGVL